MFYLNTAKKRETTFINRIILKRFRYKKVLYQDQDALEKYHRILNLPFHINNLMAVA